MLTDPALDSWNCCFTIILNYVRNSYKIPKEAYLSLYGDIVSPVETLVAIEVGNPEYLDNVEPKTKKRALSVKRPSASLKRPAANTQ